MSIATRTGDEGQTGLMYGKRVPKDDPRVEAYGTIDELNSALGLVRATGSDPWLSKEIMSTQKDLVALMGELAVAEIDHEKYQASDHPKITAPMLERLDLGVARIEAENVRFEGWATPGETLHAAALDCARSVCRRAERRVFTLSCEAGNVNPLILKYLNRLSDFLWLLARREESTVNGKEK
ncbi:MAG: cob(I)yrinic acid a,c-diamide adenosyltransferase [Methylacidiphilales bacterium]|nr:cob(I)yrinic acid a,c-diamide adenosyltransferase [Candidatus Methylacidiphilales bacterium]